MVIRVGFAMNAKNTRTGRSQNVKSHNVSLLEHVLAMSLEKKLHSPARRRSPEEVHATLILIIGSTLAAVFLIVTLGITYALIFTALRENKVKLLRSSQEWWGVRTKPTLCEVRTVKPLCVSGYECTREMLVYEGLSPSLFDLVGYKRWVLMFSRYPTDFASA